MSKKGILIGLLVVAGLAVAAVFTGKKPVKNDAQAPEGAREITREISEIERKKIAAEYGRKGAAKSAEVRRARKAAREKAKEVANNEVSTSS